MLYCLAFLIAFKRIQIKSFLIFYWLISIRFNIVLMFLLIMVVLTALLPFFLLKYKYGLNGR
ncbi:hypothetical protein GGTG_07387 [Gaeumannomyces tritici R3-111a-1]|uniref:Uncharacterized protein n=1 Tax=Gaeumannomyces tritici (strain R3-111a-1) TaxID=644352 RepID=J3P1I9_GAET3|nr:hypothetical protein GGTG_07387 [Gaeumannomyces tritici R3-111a-1]EJT73531.1 hypothetical protein GGTG_07387 [Gaeumannomyces tritici R3-111a-1]